MLAILVIVAPIVLIMIVASELEDNSASHDLGMIVTLLISLFITQLLSIFISIVIPFGDIQESNYYKVVNDEDKGLILHKIDEIKCKFNYLNIIPSTCTHTDRTSSKQLISEKERVKAQHLVDTNGKSNKTFIKSYHKKTPVILKILNIVIYLQMISIVMFGFRYRNLIAAKKFLSGLPRETIDKYMYSITDIDGFINGYEKPPLSTFFTNKELIAYKLTEEEMKLKALGL